MGDAGFSYREFLDQDYVPQVHTPAIRPERVAFAGYGYAMDPPAPSAGAGLPQPHGSHAYVSSHSQQYGFQNEYGYGDNSGQAFYPPQSGYGTYYGSESGLSFDYTGPAMYTAGVHGYHQDAPGVISSVQPAAGYGMQNNALVNNSQQNHDAQNAAYGQMYMSDQFPQNPTPPVHQNPVEASGQKQEDQGHADRINQGKEADAPIQKSTRTDYSDRQLEFLISVFRTEKSPSVEKREEIAQTLGLTSQQVKIWFKNRRAREGKSRKTEESARKRTRTKYTKHQQEVLGMVFREYPNPKDGHLEELSQQLDIKKEALKLYFKNRRADAKKSHQILSKKAPKMK